MKCKISKAQLIGFLYREMPEGEMAALEAHINTCADCRTELESLQSATDILATWQEEDVNLNLTFVNEGDISGKTVLGFPNRHSAFRMAGLFAASILLGFMLMTLARYFWLDSSQKNIVSNDEPVEKMLPNERNDLRKSTPAILDDSASQLTFENKFTTPTQAEAVKKRLAITENVNAIENLINTECVQKNQQRFAQSGKTRGVYLTGKGMIFLVNTEADKEFRDTEAVRILEKVNKHKNVEFFDSARNHDTHNHYNNHVKEFKSAVLNIVHTNENTFKLLAPEESIVIAVDAEVQKEAKNGFIIELNKKDIDTFKHGKIDMQELLKKVRVSDYK